MNRRFHCALEEFERARVRCEVPFCRRTTKRQFPPEAGERWVCCEHWRLTDRRWRRRLALFRRRKRFDLAHRAWDRLRDQAVERAAGIA